MSRRLLPMLLAAIAVSVAASTPTAAPGNIATSAGAISTPGGAATDIQPVGAPSLSLYADGRSTLGPDGKLYIRTDEPGSLDVVAIAPPGNSESGSGSFSLVASKNAQGWDAAPPPVSPGPALISEFHWQPGASSLTIALSYVRRDGSTSPPAVRTIVAVSDNPTVHIAQVIGLPNTTTASLAWTEADGIGPGIVDRRILREEAPATTQGCGTWTERAIQALSAADPTATTSAPILEATVAATPGGQDGLPSASGSLRMADLSLGRCYRFTLFVTDALGLVGEETSPVYVPGLLDPYGRPLAAWTGKIDMFRASAFSSQQAWTWCVGASTQMMVNLIRGTSDHSYQGQLTIQNYARDTDPLPLSDPGSGLTGWREALNKFSGTPYEIETVGSLQGAVNLAALRLRLTGRPVGLAVKDTTHAWVMTGFEATADPAFDPAFTVTAVYVSGPLYPRQQSHGYDMPPDTRLTVSDLGTYFTPVWWKSRLTWEFLAPLP
jgi:hypothetical protein